MQANVAAAVLQVVLVAAAFVAGQRWQSGEGLTELRFPALYPAGCSYGGVIDANAKVRVLFFVAFWARFVSRVRSPSGPARRVGALRGLRDVFLPLCSVEQGRQPALETRRARGRAAVNSLR